MKAGPELAARHAKMREAWVRGAVLASRLPGFAEGWQTVRVAIPRRISSGYLEAMRADHSTALPFSDSIFEFYFERRGLRGRGVVMCEGRAVADWPGPWQFEGVILEFEAR